ncbi:MAG: transporter substrate-binding domain-containing protein [Desulfamplus sp.]|nr:transporter substrate-binding domain-containing protein [Desulfamplus sp.]
MKNLEKRVDCSKAIDRSIYPLKERVVTGVIHLGIISILLAGLFMLGCGDTVKDPLTYEERKWLNQHDGKIIVNNESGWPPIIDIDQHGNPLGIVIDYQRLLERKLNFKFKLDKPDSWENFMERFRTGKIHVNNNLQRTPEREQTALFTEPYIKIPNAIIVRKENKSSLALDKMTGMEIAVTRNFAIHDHIKKKYDYLNLIPLDDDEKCLLATATKNVDAAVVNLAVASYIIENKGIANLRIAGYSDYSNQLCFASRKDWPILNRILEKGLSLITQAEKDAIYRSWISLESMPFYKNRDFWIIICGVTFFFIAFLLMIIVWNRSLKRLVDQRTEKLVRQTEDLKNEVEWRKQAEESLKESEERFRSLSDGSMEALFFTKDGFCIEANNAAAEIFGYQSPSEFIGRFGTDIIAPESHEIVKKHMLKNNFNPYEAVGIRRNGQKFPISIRAKSMSYKDKGVVRVTSITDITERKSLEAQLIQAQKMESVGRLAGGVAHDFNNMLGVILGHTELALLKAEEDNDLISDLKEIQNAAKRSANLTKQLLAFARKEIISPKKLDLSDTVESMLNMLRRLIGEDIDLVWKPSSHLWPVKMDPSQIDQILANLCVNARDAIDGVGKLTIETGIKTFDEEYCKEHAGFIPGDFVMLAVSDNGCGMEKDTLANLFEPFFTTKEVGKGTGLGLATIYGIVKQNNGFINVYSEPGLGSTFKIYLPRLVAKEDTDKEVPEKKAAAGGSETILLVEDEPMILDMTTTMLEMSGYTVLAAASPDEAIRLAKDHTGKIHLLMSDVVMPEMNGRDLAGQINDLYPDIRLLFMSGYTSNVIAHHGILDDGVEFMQKPFSMADMSAKVRELLDMASDKNRG